MRSLAAIRTHRWGVEEERLLAALRPTFGEDVAVVYHNAAPGLTLPAPVVPMTRDWVVANGLKELDDWGWRCGDYAYYALRAARPGYDAYWLIEPDVVFTGDARGFFPVFSEDTTDALGFQAGPFASSVRFVRGMTDLPVHRAIFAMTRLSGRLIDRLFALRQDYSRSRVRPRDFANDEVFVFTHAKAEPGMTFGRLEDRAPGWFDGVQFDPDPDLLDEIVLATAPKDRVFHPVRSRASLKSALAKRLCARTQFLWRMAPAIGTLSDADIDEVVAGVAGRVRAELKAVNAAADQRRATADGGAST